MIMHILAKEQEKEIAALKAENEKLKERLEFHWKLGDIADKSIIDQHFEIEKLKAENERLKGQVLLMKHGESVEILKLQADKAELLKCLEDINMALPITGYEHTRYYVLSLIRKHEAK